jgi:hypothetical protein
VVIFSGITPLEFTSVIDKLSSIFPNWYKPPLDSTVFVVSPLTATQIREQLKSLMPQIGYILILDAQTDRNGWLPKTAWEFLRNPKPAGE